MYGVTAAGLYSLHDEHKTQAASVSGALDKHDRDVLGAAMDEIIPAGNTMPAASEVGSVDYLDKLAGRDKQAAQRLRESLTALEELSYKRFQAIFLSLSHEQRIESLTALEKGNMDDFKVLRDYVYEAYYTRPTVWKLLGYEFYPTNMSGPHMKPFDEAVLADVRKKPKYYREV